MENFKKLSKAEMKNLMGGDGDAQCGMPCGVTAEPAPDGHGWIGVSPTDPRYICGVACAVCQDFGGNNGGVCTLYTWY